jgi:hypothetical protein
MADAEIATASEPKRRLRETAPWWPLLAWLGPFAGLALFSFIPLMTVGATWVMASGWSEGWLGYVHWIMVLLIIIALPVQGTLIGLCWGLGGGAFWQRTFGVLVTVMAASQCLLLGYLVSVLSNWLMPPDGQFFFLDLTHWLTFEMLWHFCLLCGCGLPLLLMGFQIPFLLMRIFFHWRLVRAEQHSEEKITADEQLSIRDLLLGTALVAVSLAAAQFEGRRAAAEGRQAQNSYLFGILIGVAASTAVTTATILPLTAVFLRRFNLPTAWLYGGLIASAVVALYAIPTIALNPNLDWLGFLIVVAAILLYYVGVATGLSLLRVYGWRLYRERKLAT